MNNIETSQLTEAIYALSASVDLLNETVSDLVDIRDARHALADGSQYAEFPLVEVSPPPASPNRTEPLNWSEKLEMEAWESVSFEAFQASSEDEHEQLVGWSIGQRDG